MTYATSGSLPMSLTPNLAMIPSKKANSAIPGPLKKSCSPDLAMIPSKKANSTARCALRINELLTFIFANLPYRDLFICRRVCKYWKSLLTWETPVVHWMFIKPIYQAPWTPLSFGEVNSHVDVKRLSERCERWRTALNSERDCRNEPCVELRPMRHKLPKDDYINPLMREMALGKNTCLYIRGDRAMFLVLNREDIERLLRLLKGSWKDASWRKTLLTNPPVKHFFAFSPIRGDTPVNDEGITMGQVADHLKEVFDMEESGRAEAAFSDRHSRIVNALRERR
ncbi:hypothetical protein CC78DRAFT_590146 [Lojkania enalia]|uniref:F-box domain-containing protein n=1 Tax=Lojkania enalia TaxID=147567 RepID=A0A9P4KEW3_9PLEO|nr:hypothetical protein CC78DRAFT_590146 [Didymosphaeria enalia]